MKLPGPAVILATVVLISNPVKAQSARNAMTSDALLMKFQRDWNETDWQPKSGRRTGYMRPLDDAGWKTRMTVMQRLVAGGKSVVPGLVKALKSDDGPTRILAAQTLGYLAPHVPTDRLKQVFESEPDAAVRLYAADALGMQGDSDLSEFLRKQMEQAKNHDVRRHLSYAIEREANGVDPAVIRTLVEWDAGTIDSARVGQPAPDFELQTIGGKPVRLSSFRGKKPVVLVFIYGDT